MLQLKETSIPVIVPLGGISKSVTSSFLKTENTSTPPPPLPPHPDTTVIIHPGSRWLKIGKAKAAFPAIIPHCIAHSLGGKNDMVNCYSMVDDNTAQVTEEDFDGLVEELYGPSTHRKRLPPSFYPTLQAFNEGQAKNRQSIPLHNDSFGMEKYAEFGTHAYLTGMDALRLDPDQVCYSSLHWPLWNGGRFNPAYSTHRAAILGDLDRIWTDSMTRDLGIPIREIRRHCAVIVIDDSVSGEEICAYTELALQLIGFRAVAFLRCSQAATFGCGLSSSLVIDVGAQKISVAGIEDGVLVPGSAFQWCVGGDQLLLLFHKLLQVNRFQVPLDPGKPLDWELLERDLWLKEACIDEQELTASAVVPVEFFRRHPGRDTTVHVVKMLDERCIPILEIFKEDCLLNRFLSKDEKKVEFSQDADDDDDNDNDDDGNQMIIPLNGPFQSLVERSLAALQTSSDERVQKLAGSVLIIGGGLPVHLHSQVIALLCSKCSIRLEGVQLGIDPRHVAWKGGAVLAKLDSVSECWLEAGQWRQRGKRLLAEKLPFAL